MSVKWSWVTRKEDKQASLRISEGKFEGVADIDREEFGEDSFKIIGDILVDIIDEQLQEENLEYRPDD